GKTGILMSVVGLGTVKLGRSEGVKYPATYAIPDDRSAAALLDKAESLGINVIDTAPAYGTSEERLGKLIGGRRDRWVVVTKAGEEFSGGSSRFDFSPSAIRASVERSLRRLGTDRLDLLLVHSDGLIERGMPDELWAELSALRSEGKTRAYGVSTKGAAGSRACLPHCEALMVTIGGPDETGVVASARTAGVGILVKKALDSGRASEPGPALRRAVQTPGVTSVIVGTINPDHLEDNARWALGTGPGEVGTGSVPAGGSGG
nr:aldo/keto reductase [Phycisphaerales bacterium]